MPRYKERADEYTTPDVGLVIELVALQDFYDTFFIDLPIIETWIICCMNNPENMRNPLDMPST